MTAEPVGEVETSDGAAERERRNRALALALREIALRTAKRVGGGVALVFAHLPGDDSPDGPTKLRSAAGFQHPHEARTAAQALLPTVRQVIDLETPATIPAPEPMAEHAEAGVEVHSVVFEGRVLGALAVGFPDPIDDDQKDTIAEAAQSLALRLDHAYLLDRAGEAPKAEVTQLSDDDDGEEVLKLSEALFARDIELLRNNEKLGKIEKLKNDFIEKMSKELRTPLNSIIEAIISVLTGENEALSEDAKRSLRGALDDGTAFLRTLQNILDLWKIKQNELPADVQEMNFREMVNEAIFSLHDALSGKAVKIEQELEEPFPKIRTDLAKINQILFLLLDNAVKFTPEGDITISARVVDDQLLCEVRDTGIGICRDDLEFVFDEFYQVDDGSADQYRGAGLGLALVRDLVRLLEGDVSIESEVGRGTAVTFQVPVQVVT